MSSSSSFFFFSSFFSQLHSHLKTAGARAVHSLLPLLLQYGLAGQGAPSIQLFSFFGCPLLWLPRHCLLATGPVPLERGMPQGLPRAGLSSARVRFLPIFLQERCQGGCQQLPGTDGTE